MGANPKAQASRETKRKVTTANIMEGVMEGGEISKRREAELAKASRYGRGIKLTDLGQTGQRIVASTPTLKEVGGDFKRAVFGGQAKDPQYLREENYVDRSSGTAQVKKNYAKDFLDKPTKDPGILPTLVKKGGVVGTMISSALTGKKKKNNRSKGSSLLAKERQGYQDDPYSVPTLLGKKLGDS